MRFLLVVFALPMLLAFGQDTKDDLASKIKLLIEQSKLADAKIGMVVYSTKQDRVLYTLNPDRRLIPASNTKLFTTACALHQLGPDFKYKTEVYLRGPVEDNTLKGDLIVVSGGDPNISGRWQNDQPTLLFKAWGSKAKEKGIARIEGGIRLINTIFDGEYIHPDWFQYDLWYWWAAPVSAFSFNDNCIDVKVAPTEEGKPCKVELNPMTNYVKLTNRTKTVADHPKPITYRRQGQTNEIIVEGELTQRSKELTFWVAIHDPTKYFGTILYEAFESQGIQIKGKIEEFREPFKPGADAELIDTFEFDLPRTIQVCNQVSQNFYAEMLLKLLGHKAKGKGTWETGLAALETFLKELKIEPKLRDGSGLSRRNEVSANDVFALLKFMRTHKHAKPWMDSLAVSGEVGTIKNRMRAIKGKVRAKTGHLARVSSLSGYVETKAGDTMIFSILINDYKGEADGFQDKVCQLLHDLPSD